MTHQRELVIGIFDLYILRDGWTQTMMRLCAPENCTYDDDDEEITVEICLKKLNDIQAAIREWEALSASMECHATFGSKTAN